MFTSTYINDTNGNDNWDLRPPSYLQARDPSVIGYNRCRYADSRLCQNLLKEFGESAASADLLEEDHQLKVYLRIKGGQNELNEPYKIENDVTLSCIVPNGSMASRSNRNENLLVRKFTFNNIFDPETTQTEMFNRIMKPKILNFINGRNCTLLAYGVSGSGKTYTMIGSAEYPGIIPRSLDYIFRTLSMKVNEHPILKPLNNGQTLELFKEAQIREIKALEQILNDPQAKLQIHQQTRIFSEMERRLSSDQVGIIDDPPPIIGMWISFAEVYNENIYDLLQPLPQRGHTRTVLKIGGLYSNSYIKGLKLIYVRSSLEAYQVLQYGLHNLSYAATALNQHSSRSHCVFTIRLISGKSEISSSISEFNFCDLAGSERFKKTNNQGDRLKESVKINASLSVLGRCISCIRDNQLKKRELAPPFRESKLTQLLQKPLQGKDDIFMIANISSSIGMFDDTLQTLGFTAIASQIITEDIKHHIINNNVAPDNNVMANINNNDGQDPEIDQMRNTIAELTLKLSEQEEFSAEQSDEIESLKDTYNDIIKIKNEEIYYLKKELSELTEEFNKIVNRSVTSSHDADDATDADDDSVIVLNDSSDSAKDNN